jgi:hypothetical protein
MSCLDQIDLTDIENDIKITDSRDNLLVYCYEECNDESHPRIKEYRGVVTDLSGNIVLKTFGYTPEYQCMDTYKDMFEDMFPDMKNYKVFDSHEGCLIRIFYMDKWFISTHKKLDAYTSKWSSRQSFGEIFEESLYTYYQNNPQFQLRIGSNITNSRDVVTNFLETLDPTRSYMFLIRNTPDNRIVCNAPTATQLYYTGSFLRDGTDFNFVSVDIDTPAQHTFDTVGQMMEYVNNSDHMKIQGVIIFSPKPVKIYNQTYWEFFNLRGNEPSVKFRYLQLRTSECLDKYMALYPEHASSFQKYEEILDMVARNIHQCYIKRYIKKEFAIVPQEQYPIVCQSHNWYMANRSSRDARVTLGVVVGIMNQQEPTVLNKIIRAQLLKEKKEQL